MIESIKVKRGKGWRTVLSKREEKRKKKQQRHLNGNKNLMPSGLFNSFEVFSDDDSDSWKVVYGGDIDGDKQIMAVKKRSVFTLLKSIANQNFLQPVCTQGLRKYLMPFHQYLTQGKRCAEQLKIPTFIIL